VKVMGLHEVNNVMKAFGHFMGEGQVNIYKVTEMTDDQIHEMKFKGTKGALWSLPKGQTRLTSFKELYWERVRNNDPMSDELLTMRRDDFEDYKQNLILKQPVRCSG